MAKELKEIRKFLSGTISNPEIQDTPSDSASYSLNVDSYGLDGRLNGRNRDTLLRPSGFDQFKTKAEGGTYRDKPSTAIMMTSYLDDINNRYFIMHGPTTSYYIWFNVNSGGVDPEVENMTGIEVPLDQVSTHGGNVGNIQNHLWDNLMGAFNPIAGHDFTVTYSNITLRWFQINVYDELPQLIGSSGTMDGYPYFAMHMEDAGYGTLVSSQSMQLSSDADKKSLIYYDNEKRKFGNISSLYATNGIGKGYADEYIGANKDVNISSASFNKGAHFGFDSSSYNTKWAGLINNNQFGTSYLNHFYSCDDELLSPSAYSNLGNFTQIIRVPGDNTRAYGVVRGQPFIWQIKMDASTDTGEAIQCSAITVSDLPLRIDYITPCYSHIDTDGVGDIDTTQTHYSSDSPWVWIYSCGDDDVTSSSYGNFQNKNYNDTGGAEYKTGKIYKVKLHNNHTDWTTLIDLSDNGLVIKDCGKLRFETGKAPNFKEDNGEFEHLFNASGRIGDMIETWDYKTNTGKLWILFIPTHADESSGSGWFNYAIKSSSDGGNIRRWLYSSHDDTNGIDNGVGVLDGITFNDKSPNMLLFETRSENPLGCSNHFTDYRNGTPVWTDVPADADTNPHSGTTITDVRSGIKISTDTNKHIGSSDTLAINYDSVTYGVNENLPADNTLRYLSYNMGLMSTHDFSACLSDSNWNLLNSTNGSGHSPSTMYPTLAPLEYGLVDISIPFSGKTGCNHIVTANVLFGKPWIRIPGSGAVGDQPNWNMGVRFINGISIQQHQYTLTDNRDYSGGNPSDPDEHSTDTKYKIWAVKSNAQENQPHLPTQTVSNRHGYFILSDEGNTGAEQFFDEPTGQATGQLHNTNRSFIYSSINDTVISDIEAAAPGTATTSAIRLRATDTIFDGADNTNCIVKTLQYRRNENYWHLEHDPNLFFGADRGNMNGNYPLVNIYRNIRHADAGTSFIDSGGKLQVNSTNHGFFTGDYIIISGTTNYNNSGAPQEITSVGTNTFVTDLDYVSDEAGGTDKLLRKHFSQTGTSSKEAAANVMVIGYQKDGNMKLQPIQLNSVYEGRDHETWFLNGAYRARDVFNFHENNSDTEQLITKGVFYVHEDSNIGTLTNSENATGNANNLRVPIYESEGETSIRVLDISTVYIQLALLPVTEDFQDFDGNDGADSEYRFSSTGSFISSIVDGNSGTTFATDKTYYYKLSFLYDGNQESPLSVGYWAHTPTTASANLSINITLKNVNKRVTDLILYRTDDLNKLFRVVIQQSLSSGWVLNELDAQLGEYEYTTSIIDRGDSTGTYEAINGMSETINRTMINYGISTEMNGMLYVGRCSHPLIEDASNYIFRSKYGKYSSFDWSNTNDLLILPFKPVAIKGFRGRLYCWNNSNMLVINPSASPLYIEDKYEGIGCISQKNAIVTDAGLFFSDKNHVYMQTGGYPEVISRQIEKDFSGNQKGYQSLVSNGDSMNGMLAYDSRDNILIVFCAEYTDGNGTIPSQESYAWTYNLKLKRWDLWVVERPQSYIMGDEGEALISTTYGQLHQLLRGTDRKPFDWNSKEFVMGSEVQNKMLNRVDITGVLNGSLGTDVQIYKDSSPTTESGSKNDFKISNKTGKKFQLRLSNQGTDSYISSFGLIFKRKPIK